MIPNNLHRRNLVDSAAHAALSASARRARRAQWGDPREPAVTIRASASVVDRLRSAVQEPARRAFIDLALKRALDAYDEDRCTRCGKHVTHLTPIDDRTFVCDACLGNYTVCVRCGEMYDPEVVPFHRTGAGPVCDNCFSSGRA